MYESLTNQQVFDKVWKHFVTNKQPKSLSSSGQCVYRNLRNEKCAIGVFIPDECYNRYLEGQGVQALAELDWFRKIFRDVPEDFLRVLQTLHDTQGCVLCRNAFFKEECLAMMSLEDDSVDFHKKMELGLRFIASEFNLKVPEG